LIDLYCERVAAGLWAEPVNAVTNLAFVLAAFCSQRLSRSFRKQLYVRLLLLLLLAIGLGSALFHTFATRWAMLADVIPILLFQLVFLGAYAGRVMRLPWHGVSLLLLVFLALGRVVLSMELPVNGSDSYFVPLLFLTGFGVYQFVTLKNERYLLLLAAVIFLLSLTLRSTDQTVCEYFPLGTHFLWHLLNAFVLYLCVRAYMLGERERSP